MKKMKYLFATMLVILFILPQLRSQEAKIKEDKKMTVTMIKEEDGSMTSFDTTINLDGDFNHEALARKLKEKYGIDMQMDDEDGFQFNWTTETGDSGGVKKIRKIVGEDSYIIITSDDEIEFKPDGESKVFAITKNIEVEDNGEYEVILKKTPDGSEDEMIWYEIDDEEVDGQRKMIIRSEKGHGGSKVIAKKIHVKTNDDAKMNVWVDGEKHQKVFFNSAGNESFLFKHGIQVKITNPDGSELSAAGIKIKGEKLKVENLEIMLKGEDAELSFHLSTSGKTSIELLNRTGQKIYSDKVKYFPGTYKKSLGMLPDEGAYFLQITQGSAAFIKKIKIRK